MLFTYCFFLFLAYFSSLPAGLPNYGNHNAGSSCFLNSSVQALFHTWPLREYLYKNAHLYEKGTTSQLFIDHINDMAWSGVRNNPRSFRDSITQHKDAPAEIKGMQWSQHDAQQILLHILNRLREDLLDPATDAALDQEARKVLCEGIENKELQKPLIDQIWAPIKWNLEIPIYSTQDLKDALTRQVESFYLDNSLSILRSLACIKKDLTALKKHNDEIIRINQIKKETYAVVKAKIIKYLIDTLGDKFFVLINEIIAIKSVTGKTFQESIQGAVEKAISSYFAIGTIENNLQKSLEGEEMLPSDFYENKVLYFNGIFRAMIASGKEPKFTPTQFEQVKQRINTANVEKMVKLLNEVNNKKQQMANIFRCFNQKQIFSKTIDPTWMLGLSSSFDKDAKKFALKDLLDVQYGEKADSKIIPPFPPIIIIHFKRSFATGEEEGKDNRPITFPMDNLDLSAYVPKDNKTPVPKYHLYAIVIHNGDDFSSGHYWTYAKYFQDGAWYHYDDISDPASPVNIKDIKKIADQGMEGESTGPYLLFYHRSDIVYKDKTIPKPAENQNEMFQNQTEKLQTVLQALSKRLEGLVAQMKIIK